MRIFVAVATTGRASVASATAARLLQQTRPPDGIVVVAVTEQDVAGMAVAAPGAEIELAPRGLCSQRNRALELLAGRADVVAFFDDDFVPGARYLEAVEELFGRHPEVVGATGRIVADGVTGTGISLEDAIRLVEEDPQRDAPAEPLRDMEALYGCNMVLRAAAFEGMRFDEALPLYGWLEDIDFTYRLGQRGRLVRCSTMAGVHMGSKSGRSPGRRLGYSQIANPVYLLRKRAVPPSLAFRLMRRNLLANAARSVRPESHVDRRGRLAGNLMALRDLVSGRLDPRRILDLS